MFEQSTLKSMVLIYNKLIIINSTNTLICKAWELKLHHQKLKGVIITTEDQRRFFATFQQSFFNQTGE